MPTAPIPAKPSRVLQTRLRNNCISGNFLIAVLVSAGYAILDDSGLSRLLTLLACFFVSTQLVGLGMRAVFNKYLSALFDFMDGNAVDKSALVRCILQAPWIVASQISIVWLVSVPLWVVIVESFIPGSRHSLPDILLIMLGAMPALFLLNLLRAELIFKPYAAFLDAEQRRQQVKFGPRMTVQKRLLVALMLLGPYTVAAFCSIAYFCLVTSHSLVDAQHRLAALAIFFMFSSIIFSAALAHYLGRIVDHPLRQIMEALSGGALDDADPLAFDEFGVVAELIAERKRVEEAKQSFVAVVTHELRSPLMSMQGFCKLLSIGGYGPVGDTIVQKAELAENNADRLVKLINNLLDAEKLQAGQFDCVPGKTTSTIIVNRAVDSLRTLAEAAGVQIEVNVETCELWADEDRMVQVLVNLISNALKFADGKPVRVSAVKVGSDLEFGVKDSGKGIPITMQAQLFERFRQLVGDEKSGTGLGLPIARTLVELHGGTIGVSSAVKDGSYFWVRVPLLEACMRHEGESNRGTSERVSSLD